MIKKRYIVPLASALVALAVGACALFDQIADPPNSGAIAARKAKATNLTSKGDLASALVEWRVLEALSGRDADVVRQRRKLEAEIARRATAKFELGREAAVKGSLKTARQNYMAALQIDPNHQGAIAELRKIEVVRVRRSRPKMVEPEPQGPVAAAQPAETPKPSAAATRAAAEPEASEIPLSSRSAALETAVVLAKQGAHDRAIGHFEAHLRQYPGDRDAAALLSSSHQAIGVALYKQGKLEQSVVHLEKSAAAGPGDPAAARMLADAKGRLAQKAYENGVRVFREDVGQAIAYWEESLAYDPAHAKARSYLDKAYKIQETLKSIKP